MGVVGQVRATGRIRNRNRQQKPLQNPCGASRVAAAYSMDTLQLYMPNQLVSARQDVQYNARYDVCMRLERQGVRLTNAIGLYASISNLKCENVLL